MLRARGRLWRRDQVDDWGTCLLESQELNSSLAHMLKFKNDSITHITHELPCCFPAGAGNIYDL